MATITVAFHQTGFVRFDKNTITASNYTQKLHFPSRFQRSNRNGTRKTRRIRRIAMATANSGGVIEKEHEFKPSFEEYLKAMETVKSRREKRQLSPSSDSQEQITVQKVMNSKRDEAKKKLDSKGAEIVGKIEEKDVNMKRGSEISRITSGSDSQKQIVVQKMVNLKQDVAKKKKLDSKEAQINGKIEEKHVNMKRGSEIIPITSGSDSQKQIVVQKMVNLKQDEAKKKKLDSKEAKIYGKIEEKHVNMKRDSEISPISRSYVNKEFHDVFDHPRDEFKEKWTRTKSDSKAIHTNRVGKAFQGQGFADKGRGVKHDKYGSVGVERAAFKSLEEFQDVCDQPRVSRVDMDERIQRLAKCLNGASIDTPEWNFSKMMRSAKIRFADFSMIRLIQILGNYGNWRRVLQVIEWMQSRERFKSNRIRNIYTAALDALGKARRPVEALNMFHTMQQNLSSYPDIVAYHCIAVTLGQAGHMRELFHVIDSMKSHPKMKLSTSLVQKWDPRLQPDIIVYNAVLNACIRKKNLEGAFWVLQELKQQGQQPNSITYGLVMEVMLACEKYNLVHEFFKKMQKSFIPNSLTYKVVVNTLWKEGKVDEAILAVKDMEKRGIIGSAGLYYDLARCLCSAGRSEEALVQIDKICKVANKPLVVTYTGLIQACLDSGNIESGVYIFNHMHKFCSPNLVTYNIILKGYLDNHRFEEAKDLFYKLLEKGNHVTSKVEIKHMVLPDSHTFNLMLDACFVNQRWDDLEFVYTTMLQRGYYFNAKRHSRIILEAFKAGKVNLLETTWNHLIKGDQIPPPSLVQEMFCVKLKQEDYAAAFSCVVSLPSTESHKYSRDSWLRIFQDNPRLFGEETLRQIVDSINTLSLRNEEPNIILSNMMKSCKVILRTQ